MKKQTTSRTIRQITNLVLLSTSIGWSSTPLFAQAPKSKLNNQHQSTMIETNAILLLEDPKSVYTLELKDGKPFHGYEVTEEKLVGEFPFVNYYENGELKIQYAVDFIAKDQYEAPIEYALKTTFNDGKVQTGNVYRNAPSGFLLTDQYIKGEKVGLTVDIFAMHYFNRLTFKVENNQLIIKSFDSSDEIKIYKKDAWVMADYYIDGALSQQSEPILLQVATGTPLSNTVFYYDKNQKIQQYNMLLNQERDPLFNNELLFKFYAQFSFEYAGKIEQLATIIDDYFSTATQETEEPIETIFEHLAVPYTQETLLSYVSFNQDGQPQSAVLFPIGDYEKYNFAETNIEITDVTVINQLLEVLQQK